MSILQKDFQFISIDAIIIVDDKANEADKNNQSQEYLFSLILSSLKNEKQAKQLIQQSNTSFSLNNIIKNIENIENIKNKFILNSSNILFTNTSRT